MVLLQAVFPEHQPLYEEPDRWQSFCLRKAHCHNETASDQNHLVYKRAYCNSDFITDYNAFKGNAYGLANTLMQTAILKPSCKSKKVKNLYYTGQLTVPGPGVPPSLISGEVVAGLVNREINP